MSVLNLKRLFALAIILILCSSALSITVLQPNAGGEADSGVGRIEKAVDFLINSQFNQNLNLCREAPVYAPNTYWLVSDNLWAWKALKMANASGISNAVEAGAVAEKIRTKLISLANNYGLPKDADGLPISNAHEVVLGNTVLPPYRSETNCTLYRNDYILNTTVRNGTIISNWSQYADFLVYAALSYHQQNNGSIANDYFELAKTMWDEKGINDTATKDVQRYATYKLALLLYASKILEKELVFESELINRIWSLQNETNGGIVTDYFADGTSYGDANTETTSIVIIAMLETRPTVFAFYYPWYGTKSVSGDWRHWKDSISNPDNFKNGRRDIAATDYPLLDVYDSNNETLIKEHIDMAKEAGIDGFIVSWWGIKSFEDNATLHIRNVCEKNNFKFTIYYEDTSSVNQTIDDLVYILNNYANSSAWYSIGNRPVIYVYSRSRVNLNPEAWKLHGEYINESESVKKYWMLSEDVRKPPRYGIFPIHPYLNGTGYIESADSIFLNSNETYSLKVGISDIRNDCPPYSDVGFRIGIRTEVADWKTLNDSVVNFNDGWLDLSFDISDYAGQNVTIRVESYDGGVNKSCSEWAAADYFYIENSKGEIVSPEPFFDNAWKAVVDELRTRGYNPFLMMDFTGYEEKILDFADYFLDFTDSLHIYGPCSFNLSEISDFYHLASEASHSKNKIFVATVMPGYNDTGRSGRSGLVVDRENGTYYIRSWLTARACLPDGYVITSFNEWHEATEIEPSMEYGYHFIHLTRMVRVLSDDLELVLGIPEFPSTMILPLFMLTTLIATVLLKKKRRMKP